MNKSLALRNINRFKNTKSLLLGAALIFPVLAHAQMPLQNGGTMNVNGNGGTINGNGQSGYLVLGGTLNISNATLTNFNTVGGSGSGGGAGMGGAIFIGNNSTVTVNNVNFIRNFAQGGQGGVGSVGGAMNNIQNLMSPANGYNGEDGNQLEVTLLSFVEGDGIDGKPGSDGGPGLSSGSSITYTDYNGQSFTQQTEPPSNGFGGKGGNGSNGSAALAINPLILAKIAYDTYVVSDDTTKLATATKNLADATAAAGEEDAMAGEEDTKAADEDVFAAGEDALDVAAAIPAEGIGGGIPGPVVTEDPGLIAGETVVSVAADVEAAAEDAEAVTEDTKAATADEKVTTAQEEMDTATEELGKANEQLADAETELATWTAQEIAGIVGNGGDGAAAGAGGAGAPYFGGGAGGNGGNGGASAGVGITLAGDGGDGGNGGVGGFGGGGGAAGLAGTGADIGAGGPGGVGGFGGGKGEDSDGKGTFAGGGGGGGALGGAIFVQAGSSLTLQGNITFDGNALTAGQGQAAGDDIVPGAAGIAAGTDLFMMTGSNVVLDPGLGNTITFDGSPAGMSIADDSAPSIAAAGGATSIPAGAGANITIKSGLVVFGGANLYSGTTFLAGGVLEALDTQGVYYGSHINFNGGTFESAGNSAGNATTFIRYVGTRNTDVDWTGSGGFAATGSNLIVTLGDGFQQTEQWGANSFVPFGSKLLFGAYNANSTVYFENNIDLGGQADTILITSNATSANLDVAQIDGNISDGSLVVNDATHDGILILNGTNTYTGSTTVLNGTLQLSPNGTLASTSTITVDGPNTTFDLGANHTNQTFAALTLSNGANITGTGTSSITSTTNFQLENGTVTAILAGTVGLQKTTTSLVTLSGNNTYTGDTVITAGTLAESATGFISNSSNLTVNGSTAQFDLGGNHSDTVANVTLENSGLISGTGNSTLSSNVGFQVLNGTVTAILGGTGGLNKTTSSIVYLDNTNTYTGNTDVYAGTLTLNSTGALSSSSNLNVNGTSAYFDLGANNNSPAANVTLINGFINGTGSSTLSSSVGFQVQNGTVNAILGGTAPLNKTTNGIVYLNASNTYTGDTNVYAGTLTENSSGLISDSSNLTIGGIQPSIVTGVTVALATPSIQNTAVFDLGNNHSDTVANVTLDNGFINGTGTSTLTSTVGFQVQNGTVNAILGGAGIPLNKTTGGTVFLNASNTYTGDTSIYAGTLTENSTGLIADTSNLTVNGTTAYFDLGNNHSDTVANVTLVNGFINGTGTSTLTSTVGYQVQNGTVNAILGSTVGLNKTTSGIVFLNSNNTYTGDTDVYAGTLTENSTGLIADTSNLTVNGTTAYFDLGNNHSDTVANFTLVNGTVNGTGSSTLTSTVGYQVQNGTVNAILGGTTPLNKTSSGIVYLNASNTYTGNTNVYAGTLTENSTGLIADSSNLNVNGTAAYFDLGANHSDTVANVNLINGFINGTGTSTLTSTVGYQVMNGTVNAILGGSVGLNKTTNGTVYLNSNNTYTGNTTITAGTLTENSTGFIADTSVLVVNGSPATFDLGANHSDTVGEVILSGNGNITGTGTSALTSSNTTGGFELMNGTVTAILAGNTVPLVKSTSGLVTLSGNNTYTGNTTVLAGTLAESATGFIADTSNLTINGSGNLAQFDLGANHSDTVANVTLTNGSITGTGNSTLSSNIGFQVMNGTVTAVLGGNGPLNKTTSGTVYLDGNNTYTGNTTVTNGILTLNSTGELSSASNLTVNGTTAIFDLGANNTSPVANVSLVNGGTINGTGTSTLSSSVGFQVQNGTVNAALGGTGPLNKTSNSTVYLNGNNTYTGDTSVYAGTLTLNSTGELSSASNLTVNGTTAIFDLGANHTSSAANVTLVTGLINGTGTSTLSSNVGFQVMSGNVNADLGGTGPLNKTVSNTTVYVNGLNNTYTGATTVSAGTLVINGALSTNNTVNVSSGAQLSINKNITIGTLNSSGLTTGTSILTANTYNLNDGAVVNQTLGLGNVFSTGNVTINASILSTNITILTGNMNLQQGNLTSPSASLDISLGANLVLNGGNDTVSQLNGSGVVVSGNFTLNVLNGGNFTGTVGGSGNTGGTLTLNGTSNSTNGANITNNSTVNVNGNTTLGNTTNITSGNLNVNGTVTSGNIVVNSGGTLSGAGNVSGNVINNGGTVAASDPSNLTISGNFNNNGTLDVEIYGINGAGRPNGNDNYIVTGLTYLNPAGSVLALVENSSIGNTFTNVAAGQSFKFITAAAGSISGHFASVTNPFGNFVAVDLSSGYILGTNITKGVSANIDKAFPGATANQLAMINQTEIASDTGSAQFDGGDLIQQLLTHPAATAQVFNQASPEAYAGLADYALRATRSYLNTALTLDPMVSFGKYEVFAGYNYYNAATDSSQNQADYKLDSNGGLLGFRAQVAPKVSVGLFAGFDSGTVSSNYLNTDSTGFVGGVFATVDPLASHRLLGTASFTYGDYTTRGTRSTFSGASNFSGVGSNDYQGVLDVQYVAIQQPKYSISPELDVAYSDSKVNAITEANVADPLQALQVDSLNPSSLRAEGAVNGVYNITSQIGVTGRFGVSHDFEHTYRDVTANVVGEPTSVTVRSPGLGDTDYDVGVGAFYTPIAHLRLQVNYTAGFSTQSKMSNTISVGGSYSW